MLTADFLREQFHAAAPYEAHVASGAPPKQEAWSRVYNQATLTPDQRSLLGAFTRRMHVIVSSGVWCGDCVAQCPLIQRIGEASPVIEVRFADRDRHAALSSQLRINAGDRVPVAVFAAEDFEPVGVYGDRTLTRYRALADRLLGAACELPHAPIGDDELAGTMQDWVDEFERVQLLLRLSTRLRQKHGD